MSGRFIRVVASAVACAAASAFFACSHDDPASHTTPPLADAAAVVPSSSPCADCKASQCVAQYQACAANKGCAAAAPCVDACPAQASGVPDAACAAACGAMADEEGRQLLQLRTECASGALCPSCLQLPDAATGTCNLGQTTCRRCMSKSCCKEAAACQGSCQDFWTCFDTCTTGNDDEYGCVESCGTMYPDGKNAFLTVRACAELPCIASCFVNDCQICMARSCEPATKECFDDPQCFEAFLCRTDCTTGQCLVDCAGKAPPGGAFGRMLQCQSDLCAAPCL